MRRPGPLVGIALALAACAADPIPETGAGESASATAAATATDVPATTTLSDPVGLDPDVARAVTIVRALDAHPASADSVLLAHAISLDAFEGLIFAIAADSAKSAQYARAVAVPAR